MTSAEIIAELIRKHIEGCRWRSTIRSGKAPHRRDLRDEFLGFVFADIGWDTNDRSQPFHVLEGTASAGSGGEVVTAHAAGALGGPAQRHLPSQPRPHFRPSGGPRRGALARLAGLW